MVAAVGPRGIEGPRLPAPTVMCPIFDGGADVHNHACSGREDVSHQVRTETPTKNSPGGISGTVGSHCERHGTVLRSSRIDSYAF